MQYMGGKSGISSKVAQVVQNLGGQELTTFVSLFCGSCSIEAKVQAKIKIFNDKHSYLIAMWKGTKWIQILRIIIIKTILKIVQNVKNINHVNYGTVEQLVQKHQLLFLALKKIERRIVHNAEKN